MIRVILHKDGETIEAHDDVIDLTPLGVRYYHTNDAGVKTGEWLLIPWSSIREVHRIKNKPRRIAAETKLSKQQSGDALAAAEQATWD